MVRILLVSLTVFAACVFTPREASAHCHTDKIPCDIVTTVFVAVATVAGVANLVSQAMGYEGFMSYLRANRTALAAELTLGAGPTIEDLAHHFAVEDVASFGKALRRDRRRLMELMSEPLLAREGAHLFARHVLALQSQN